MFILFMSCMTTPNLSWFMDLTFHVTMQYCSLQHRTLLHHYYCCFGSVSSFFLELNFPLFPIAYWTPTYFGSSSFSVISFWHFLLFMGFSRQEYWDGLPFSSLVENSINLTQTHPETTNRSNISQMLFRVHHILE